MVRVLKKKITGGTRGKRRKKAFPSLPLSRGRWHAENLVWPVIRRWIRMTEGVGIEPIWHERITKESSRTGQKNDHEDKTISRNRETGEKQRRNGSGF